VLVDNTEATLTGAWTSQNASPGFVGTDYLIDDLTHTSSATWSFTAPSCPTNDCIFEVFIRYPDTASTSVLVTYTVTNGVGTQSQFQVNQLFEDSQFISLGDFNLSTVNGGASGSVRLNPGATGDQVVAADAVLFCRKQS